MKVTFYSHSTFLIETKGKKLLFDPFFTGNPLAKDIDADEIEADFILLTHAHGDHIADAVSIAKRTGALIISNYEITNWAKAQDLSAHPINHGGKWQFDFGFCKYVNAVHTSTFPDGTNGGDPGGFVIWNEEGCFYHAGDTALTMDMKLIPLTCPPLDFAILPIGDNFTMGYEDAAIAADFIECSQIFGCHFDTFGYIEIDKKKAKAAFEARNKNLMLLSVGQTWEN